MLVRSPAYIPCTGRGWILCGVMRGRIQANIPATGVAPIYSGTQCAQVGLAVALLPLRPDSTVTDARSNRSWQLATGNTNTPSCNCNRLYQRYGVCSLEKLLVKILCRGFFSCTLKNLKKKLTQSEFSFSPLRAHFETNTHA